MKGNAYFEQAENKLNAEAKKNGFGQHERVMKESVKTALLDFCRQDYEFAQAVVQGGTFGDCMKAVAKCIKNNSISDLDAYTAAVQFYFPGAVIRMQMTIDLIGEAGDEAPGGGIILDFSQFL